MNKTYSKNIVDALDIPEKDAEKFFSLERKKKIMKKKLKKAKKKGKGKKIRKLEKKVKKLSKKYKKLQKTALALTDINSHHSSDLCNLIREYAPVFFDVLTERYGHKNQRLSRIQEPEQYFTTKGK